MMLTEQEAMTTLIGRPATVTLPTMTGTRTIVGSIRTPLFIEGGHVVELTLEGMLTSEVVAGMVVEPETPIRLELLLAKAVQLL